MISDPDIRYTPAEYLAYVEADDAFRHLLVEGSHDESAFRLLIDEVVCKAERRSIVVDTAEALVESDPLNRQRIEEICNLAKGQAVADRLVGFVDRESREFNYDPELRDNISGHRVSERLVWSRGHSIENYLFDERLLREPLRVCSPHSFADALALFEEVYEAAIRVACAAGLAAGELGVLKRIRSSIRSEIVSLTASRVEPDLGAWKRILAPVLPPGGASDFIDKYVAWHKRIVDADVDVVRWLCDGHIGFRMIWAVYEQCLKATSAKAMPKMRGVLLFNLCVSSWARGAAAQESVYPVEVFVLLGCSVKPGGFSKVEGLL